MSCVRQTQKITLPDIIDKPVRYACTVPGGHGQSTTTRCSQPYSPDLTNFKRVLPVQRTKITALVEDYQRLAVRLSHCTVAADLRVVTLHNRVSHQQVIHILRFTARSHRKRTERDN